MTLFANRIEGEPQLVSVSITYGPVEVSVAEHFQHLRHFHTQLGQLLDQVEAESQSPDA